MTPLQKQLSRSPVIARVAPFVIFLLLTGLQGQFGEASRYWVYLAKTLVGAWLVWEMRALVPEMRWAISWEAIVVGIAVFALWVGLDPFYPHLNDVMIKIGLSKTPTVEPAPWNPNLQFGNDSALAWFFIAVRFIGPSLVVPPLEEVFYRSFLYRYIAKPDFQSLSLGTFHAVSFLITAVVFATTHHQWLAAILCAFAYQGLVIWKKRLGDAMTAHAITNFLLGAWVIWKGAWQFW